MKCPKCGFVSFEYLLECKGCSLELKSHKDEYEIDMDKPQMLPILAYYNQQNESKKRQVDAEIEQLHAEQGTEVLDEDLSELAPQPLEEETVTLGDLTEDVDENEIDLAATEIPDLEEIDLFEKVEDIDLATLTDDPETAKQEFGVEAVSEESQEISLNLGEELPAAPELQEEVLTLGDLIEEKTEGEEVTLDLGLDVEDSPEETLETVTLDEVTLEEPATEVVLEEKIAEAPVEEIEISLSLDEESDEPEKVEENLYKENEEEVVTLEKLLDESESDELSLGIEELDLHELSIAEPLIEEEAKTSETRPAHFETGGLELSLEDDSDITLRADELKKKEQENKSFNDLDIDLKLELE